MNLYHSEQLGELALALAKAQGEIKHAEKEGMNPHFKKSYAALDTVWDACRIPLSKNNLAITQFVASNTTDPILVTMLIHGGSGQWVRGEYVIRPPKNDPQGFGIALTYARRYSLAAIVGVAPKGDDDDGEGVMQRAPQQQQQTHVMLPMARKEPVTKPAVSDEERLALFALAKKKGMTSDDVKKWIGTDFGVEKTSLLTREQYKKLIDDLNLAKDRNEEVKSDFAKVEKFPFET